jgi:dTDP-4-dehydrorhamnose reductase
MRLLVIGANGMLGTDMLQDWKSDEVFAADKTQADICDIAQVRNLVSRVRPDWIILTAAYTDVDGSEGNQQLAFAINGDGAGNVARVASEFGACVFYVSTDYVFDGTSSRPYEPTDPIHPLNVYGASKATGEKAIQELAPDFCIGRTSWLFGAAGSSFPEKILRASESRKELTVVSDQVGSPTFTRDLAGAILKLMRLNVRGIVHITNSGTCSWCEFASEVLHQAGRDSIVVRPVSSREFVRPARRPAFSILSPASLKQHGISVRHWKDAVNVYLDDLRRVGKLNS